MPEAKRVSDISGDASAAAGQRGYGVLRHQSETRARIAEMVGRMSGDRGDGVAPYSLLSALDRLTSAALWLVVHQTFARNVFLAGRRSPHGVIVPTISDAD